MILVEFWGGPYDGTRIVLRVADPEIRLCHLREHLADLVCGREPPSITPVRYDRYVAGPRPETPGAPWRYVYHV